MNFMDRNGEICTSNQGLKIEIIEYRKKNDVDIKFENGFISKSKEYKNFKIGNIKNPYYPMNIK